MGSVEGDGKKIPRGSGARLSAVSEDVRDSCRIVPLQFIVVVVEQYSLIIIMGGQGDLCALNFSTTLSIEMAFESQNCSRMRARA